MAGFGSSVSKLRTQTVRLGCELTRGAGARTMPSRKRVRFVHRCHDDRLVVEHDPRLVLLRILSIFGVLVRYVSYPLVRLVDYLHRGVTEPPEFLVQRVLDGVVADLAVDVGHAEDTVRAGSGRRRRVVVFPRRTVPSGRRVRRPLSNDAAASLSASAGRRWAARVTLVRARTSGHFSARQEKNPRRLN